MNNADELIPTRRTLLSRLKNWNDHESWKLFFDTYWKLIYNAAVRAGLTEAEAQDVVQETVISVSKSMPNFRYDEANGSFKGWLLRLTNWRIMDQLRKRPIEIQHRNRGSGPSGTTATVERIPDPASLEAFQAAWDQEWESNLFEAAIERVKRKVDPKLYQIFDLYVCKKWPVSRVATELRISRARVYLSKHRIGKLVKMEISYLQTRPI
jgi:RNA polymerase sigma factor (sigma-70 family)